MGWLKAFRCSLNSVCLPDETRLLATSIELPPRPPPLRGVSSGQRRFGTDAAPLRLIAPRDDQRVLYLNKPGVRIGRKDELLVVKEEDKTLDQIRINDLSHVALFGNIQISTQAIQVLCEKEIPVTYFSMGGWFYGITRGHELKNVFTRMEQFRLARDPQFCLGLARQMIFGKIRNHRTMLMRLHLEPPPVTVLKLKTMAQSALEAATIEELLGTEGAAAHFYFSAFAGMLKAEDEFSAGAPGLDRSFDSILTGGIGDLRRIRSMRCSHSRTVCSPRNARSRRWRSASTPMSGFIINRDLAGRLWRSI